MKVITIRDVTNEECEWLSHDIPSGSEFYLASDEWGCCGPGGVAVSVNQCGIPYFEIPADSIKEYFGPIFSMN